MLMVMLMPMLISLLVKMLYVPCIYCYFFSFHLDVEWDLSGCYYYHHNTDCDGDGNGGVDCFGVNDRSNSCFYFLLS